MYSPLDEVRRHMANMGTKDWAKLAHEMRGGRVMRIFSDQQLMLLMAAWATDQAPDHSLSHGELRLAA